MTEQPIGIPRIELNGQEYPAFQANGFAARFAFPFAKEVCFGLGLDIGPSKIPWMFQGARVEMAHEMQRYDNDRMHTDFEYFVSCTDESFFSNADRCTFPVDPVINAYDAHNLPVCQPGFDYIFSSHCLEQVPNWVGALDTWMNALRPGGVLFLYLPHYGQHYGRPWHNRKNLHCFLPNIVGDYFNDHQDVSSVYIGSQDMNSSFMVMVDKTPF